LGYESSNGSGNKKLILAVQLSYLGLSCQDCREKEALRLYRGCDGGGKLGFQYDGKVIDYCPMKLITANTNGYIQYYSWFKNGFLPLPGSIAQQPIKVLEAFNVLEGAEIDAQDKK